MPQSPCVSRDRRQGASGPTIDSMLIAPLPSLADALTATILLPGDPGWDEARSAFNLLLDQHPAAVALPDRRQGRRRRRSPTPAARAARRAAGDRPQPGAARRPREGTLLLNVSGLQEVRVDPGARRVRVGAGVKWDRVAPRLSAHGLAGLHGSSPDVGIAGYSLGGGMGWLARKYGLQTNAVTAFELVTADGKLVRADAEHHPDLFWALRGGGGNFGVVTAIEFEVQRGRRALRGRVVLRVRARRRGAAHLERAAAHAARRAHVLGVGDPLPAAPRRAAVRARAAPSPS